jgi:23S rRNA pseudouridine1911/1915/1917 synthase
MAPFSFLLKINYILNMMNPKIISKNKDYLIINKPAGLLVHRSVLNREDIHPEEKTLTDWLLKKYPKIKNVGDDPENRPGIVHRLDRETSGVMIIPLNQKTFEYFKKNFQKHEVKKTYLVLVYGTVRSDRVVINKPIGIKSGTTKRSVHSSKMSKDAITELEVVERFELKGQGLTLLRAYPKTGRTHQIRVHLASIHCPVVGDKLYGRKNDMFPEIGRQFLHAEEIEFKDMNGKELKFRAGLPTELKKLLVQAGITF